MLHVLCPSLSITRDNVLLSVCGVLFRSEGEYADLNSHRLLGFMGGPLDKTYTIYPHQMRVNTPLNANDADLPRFLGLRNNATPAASTPLPLPPSIDVPTDASYLLQRIRVAEICRAVIDALPLGEGDIDSLPYGQLLAIDQLFEKAVAAFPPSMRDLSSPLPPDAPCQFDVQRRVLLLAFHARRARMYIAFLDPATTATDARKMPFRRKCRESAKKVLEIASDVLKRSMGGQSPPPNGSGQKTKPLSSSPATHRSGTVISHMFMACVVIATDPSLRGENGSIMTQDPEAEECRVILEDGCRLLEKMSGQSELVAELLKRLVGVLGRHGVESTKQQHLQRQAEAMEGNDQPGGAQMYGSTNDPRIAAATDLISLRQDVAPVGQWQGLPQLAPDPPASGDASQYMSAALPVMAGAQGPVYGGFDGLGIDLTGLWDDVLNGVRATDGWSGLFADLDSYMGPV